DQFDPGTGHGVVVLPRRALVGGDLPDPGAHLVHGRRHAGAPHGQEREVDVLAVPERAVRAGDVVEDRGQLRVAVGHQTSCSAVTTAWYPATWRADSPARACRSRSVTARRTWPATARPGAVRVSRNDRRSAGSSSRTR